MADTEDALPVADLRSFLAMQRLSKYEATLVEHGITLQQLQLREVSAVRLSALGVAKGAQIKMLRAVPGWQSSRPRPVAATLPTARVPVSVPVVASSNTNANATRGAANDIDNGSGVPRPCADRVVHLAPPAAHSIVNKLPLEGQATRRCADIREADSLKELCAMGFKAENARFALSINGGNVTAAVDHLLAARCSSVDLGDRASSESSTHALHSADCASAGTAMHAIQNKCQKPLPLQSGVSAMVGGPCPRLPCSAHCMADGASGLTDKVKGQARALVQVASSKF